MPLAGPLEDEADPGVVEQDVSDLALRGHAAEETGLVHDDAGARLTRAQTLRQVDGSVGLGVGAGEEEEHLAILLRPTGERTRSRPADG